MLNFVSLKYSKFDRIWTVRWKRQISGFRFQIFANGMGFGLWTRPLGLHTMTGQRLHVDYLNVFIQPKGLSSRHSLVQKSDASPLNLGIM
jgi:hypothetical protein